MSATYRPGDEVRIPIGRARTPNGYLRTASATVIEQRGQLVRVRPLGKRPVVLRASDLETAAREHGRRVQAKGGGGSVDYSQRPAVKRPITAKEAEALRRLRGVRFSGFSGHRRFVEDLRDATEVTDRQGAHILRLAWRYRRQIGVAHAVALVGNARFTGLEYAE